MNRKNRSWGGVVATLLVVSMAFWGVSPATADAGSGPELSAVGGKPAAEKIEAAMSAVEQGAIAIHAPANTLDRTHATVYTIGSAQGDYTSVTIPVKGDFSLLSNFTVVFDAAGRIAQYNEMLLTENTAGNFNITSYADGGLVSSQDTDIQYTSDADLRKGLAGAEAGSPGGVSTMAKNTGACLGTVLGVGGVAGALIAWACAGSCAAAAIGVGVPFCVACIAAYATIGGASITAVASCF